MHLIRFGPPSISDLTSALAEMAGAEVTYDHVGSTLDPATKCHTQSIDLGEGTFAEAMRGLRAWACHEGIGATVHPVGAPIHEGTTVLVVLRRGPLRVLVPNRIVRVVDEDSRFGFAYGTLPGHPERGEESFVVARGPDGRTTATIRVDATGDSVLARLGGPVIGHFQHRAVDRYLTALARYVADERAA